MEEIDARGITGHHSVPTATRSKAIIEECRSVATGQFEHVAYAGGADPETRGMSST